MNYYTKSDLISTLGASTNLVELSSSDDSSVIISEYGGRPLGIFPKNDAYSLLWIAPDLKDVISNGGFSIGGDRFWISPERDYFYENPQKWEGWFCPPTLDPANYQILGEDSKSCTLSTAITLTNMSKKIKYQGEISRQISLIDEPISTGLNYIGIEYLDDCILYAEKVLLNGWSLATIISGGPSSPGTVIIPTKKDPNPISYFRKIPEDRLHVGKNYVSYKIDVDDIYKLAIRPEDINFDLPAKIAYVVKMPDSKDWGLLIKLSDDIPKTQDECFDVSRDHSDAEIGVIQSYNAESPDKSNLQFGEIEMQLNLFEPIDNTTHGKFKHRLLAYLGSKDEIIETLQKYIKVENPLLF